MEGTGIFVKDNGMKYVGLWKRDKPNGKGV